MAVLRTLRDVLGDAYYASGGFVRNKLWDLLHGFSVATPLDDVDIVYFNPLNTSASNDHNLEARLIAAAPDVPWSVKNQARMHVLTDDEPYKSLDDALWKWPETATAVAVRLDLNGNLLLVAPHGLTDLVDLVVRPTPHFCLHPERYEQRLRTKNWSRTWPKLQVTHLRRPEQRRLTH
jgi:hypothetical protein